MQLFQEAYKQVNYLDFLDDKFNFNKFINPLSVNNNEVEKFKKLGFITTADNKQLPVFEIYIKPNTQLSRNRVQLRNLVAKQIEIEEGALAVYVDDKNQQWRFSFIAIEYTFTEDGVTKIQTANKRFTYLLGKEAQTRTIIKRFGRLDKQSTLADLKNAFAVEPLSKEFYKKLYTWYEKAQKEVVFPNDEHAKNHTQTSLIRLITRLLFVWFLKQKQLINKDLFECDKLKALLDYDKDSSFYKAILQNLFFATLSTEIHNRKFSSEIRGHKGHNPDFGNQYVFRYQDIFIEQNESKIMALFAEIPFLNGGLFDCLDDKKKGLYIDGFSRIKKHQPIVPNNLFFSNDDNDEKNLGLIDLLGQYQFTTQESTPLDIEVALDPELLGKVFENLLASYNPETGQQARKATGSFYTPREIVNYMVDESLKQHFKAHTDLTNSHINDLFIEGDNSLTPEQVKNVISVIDALKILDPAVGSGAYPMGLLQRLIFILEKIDPHNNDFKLQQLDKAEQISDKTSRNASIKAINQVFSESNKHNTYGKKLYLIENCIYGVDIQPIAILITQLRFFISLAIEQETKPNDKANNFGISPLPNLDYHFEVGDSLIGLPISFETTSIKNLLATIEPLKRKVFTESNHDKKDKLKQQIKDNINQCYQQIEKSLGYKLVFDFRINCSEVYGKKNGFDIVIGNPPYIRQENIREFKPQFKQNYQVFTGTADIYTYFYEKGIKLLNENGHLCYITSNKWMRAKYGEKLRFFFKNNTGLKQIIDFEGEQIFENATVDTNILLTSKQINAQGNFTYQKQLPDRDNPLFTMPITDLSENAYTLQKPEILALKKKIEQIGTPLKEWDISIYRGVLTGFNEAFIIDNDTKEALCKADSNSANIIKPILRGRDIKAYKHHWAGLWIINSHNGDKNNVPIDIEDYPAIKNHLDQYYPQLEKRCDQGITPYNLRDCAYLAKFAKENIVYNDITSRLSFSLSESGQYFNNTVYFIANNDNLLFQLAVLNSNLIDWYYRQISVQLGTGVVRMFSIYVKELPIPQIPQLEQQPFIDLVDKILTAKQNNQDTTALESTINQMVYQLYNLTKSEIAIVEYSNL